MHNQKGVVHFLSLLLIAIGLIVGVYLVTSGNPLKIFPKVVNISPTPRATPSSCQPRPACLDSKPRCLLPEPADGWCPTLSPSTLSPRACTEEAKQCPDGSYVGRTGPNCEFAPCPTQ